LKQNTTYKRKYYMARKIIIILVLVVQVVVLQNCSSTTPDPLVDTDASFSLIQDQILSPHCATSGCHSSTADASYQQHKLVLAKGQAYASLFNKNPQNANSLADGHKLVKPYKAAESLFFHKLSWTNNHHAGRNYGSFMPLGSTALYQGQIEFVRRWIEAGATQNSSIVDKTLLNDKTSILTDDATFTPLQAPTIGTGYQLKIEKFDVAPNFERELFVRRNLGNSASIYVNRLKFKSRLNSHHMVVYDFRNKQLLPPLNDLRDLRLPNNTLNLATVLSMSNHIFLAGGTDSQQEYVFPEGMAIQLPPQATLDLNPHYFNKTDKIQFGENYVNLYTIDQSKVSNVVKMLDLGNQNIPLPPGQRVVHAKTWTFSTARNIVMLTSHTHKLGEKFIIKIKGGKRDGEVVYETTDWEHPLIKNFEKPLELLKNEGLTSEITYFNSTNKMVNFGLTSDDEMGIIFGYFFEP
jgi:hypothetical protein